LAPLRSFHKHYFHYTLIRSGIEILSALPKLYLNDDAKPGSEWIKFTKKKMPRDKLWISLEEEESFPSLVALPRHKNLGIGRHWHFFSIIFWIGNGAAYYILLFTSNEWTRLVPTSWYVIPEALKVMMMMQVFICPQQRLSLRWLAVLVRIIHYNNLHILV
jgi:methionine sulfoxide reductase catalytic subunit